MESDQRVSQVSSCGIKSRYSQTLFTFTLADHHNLLGEFLKKIHVCPSSPQPGDLEFKSTQVILFQGLKSSGVCPGVGSAQTDEVVRAQVNWKIALFTLG